MHGRYEFNEHVSVIGLPVDFGEGASELVTGIPCNFRKSVHDGLCETLSSILGNKNQMVMYRINGVIGAF